MQIYGKLTYTDLSLSAVEGSTARGDDRTVTGESDWVYGDGRELRDSSGYPIVTLRIEDEAWSLRVKGAGDAMTLVASLADPNAVGNEAYTFEKDSCRGVDTVTR